MRITTWNINGLRAGLAKGLFDSIEALGTDVLCMQEIKARPDQLMPDVLEKISAYFPHVFWNPAQRPGYSGTATWSRRLPTLTTLGMGFEEFDIEGRAIASHFPDFWLFNIYFPNGQRDNGRVPYKLDFYARLLALCDQLHSENQSVILCGDFNTAHREIDLRHPRENAHSTGFLPEERVWIDKYLEHGFVDIFRRLYPSRVEYTWWTYLSNARKNNVGWRLDYFLISEGLCDKVENV
ncbi:MAG TPA: exodeoxyribonuclease III, partial [Leptolinea sp.]